MSDVYEWEREGTAGCQTSTSAYRGCVLLLSGGGSRFRSYLIDASASGDDVFFTHRGQLGNVGTTVGKNDLFDARVGGGFAQQPPGCAGSCKGVSPPPITPASPPSAGFAGGGNVSPQPRTLPKPKSAAQIRAERLAKALKTCRTNRNRHKRVACERQARKRYGPTHQGKPARKATAKRHRKGGAR